MILYIILIAVGLLLWINNLGYDIVDLKRDWPLLFVILGVWGLVEHVLGRMRGRNSR